MTTTKKRGKVNLIRLYKKKNTTTTVDQNIKVIGKCFSFLFGVFFVVTGARRRASAKQIKRTKKIEVKNKHISEKNVR